MKIPNWIYRSQRVGKNGKLFSAYKIRTLIEGTDKTSSYAKEEQYTKYGKFLRKIKADEFLQILNVLNGSMGLVGVRPEEERTSKLLPVDLRSILLSRKPGMTSLASIAFFDEEAILRDSKTPHEDYWLKIRPLKIGLDVFYIENRDIFLDLWILCKTAILVIKSLFK